MMRRLLAAALAAVSVANMGVVVVRRVSAPLDAPAIESVTYTADDADTTPDFDMPATRPDGDLYVVLLGTTGTAVPTLADWTLIEAGGGATAGGACYAGFRVGSSEPASYAFAGANNLAVSMYVLRFSGFNAANPINDSAIVTGNGGPSGPDSPAITTTVDNSLVLAFGNLDQGGASTTPFGPSGYDEIRQDLAPSENPLALLASLLKVTAGGEDPDAFAVGTGESWCSLTLAIEPAS
jgi:hypothetical protein